MRFAHLGTKPNGEAGTLLVPTNAVDSTALLKARTLLAWLDQRGLLRRVAQPRWVLYTWKLDPDSVQWDDAGDNVANVPYHPHMDIRDQPGTALVRNTFEDTTLFQQVYLRSSADWLRARPRVALELAQRFQPHGECA